MEYCTFLIKIFKNNKKLILSLNIFILTILVLGIPYTKWGFVADDFGGIWHAKNSNYKDIPKFFYEGSEDGQEITGPSLLADTQKQDLLIDKKKLKSNFEVTLYRPLSYVLLFLQTKFFDLSAYYYFIFIIILHALNALLLFKLFLYFFNLNLAFWGSLFFAFHSSLAGWIGIVGCQKYPLGLTFLLLSIYFLKKYLDNNKLQYYLLSCFIIFISLFFMEHLIVMPIWVFFLIYFYKNNLLNALKISSGFIFNNVFYLSLRYFLFPSAHIESGNFKKVICLFFERQIERFLDYLTYLVNLINLNWLFGGHRFLKGFLILLICFLLIFPFIYKKKFKELIFLSFSILLFSWPVIWLTHMPRYFYVAIPFFVFLVLFSVSFYIEKFAKNKKYIFIFLYSILIFNICFLINAQIKQETKLNIIVSAFKDLASQNITDNKPICFIGLPNTYFGSCNRQALYLYKKNYSCPVYYDRKNFICLNPEINKKIIEILFIKNGFNFKILDKVNNWFCCDKNEISSLGKVQINKVNEFNLPLDINYFFDSRLLKQKPLFVAWDYEKNKFLVL
ncbi:MAG: hypothetical protein WC436_05210 [Candidatus Babeliales bacterium]